MQHLTQYTPHVGILGAALLAKAPDVAAAIEHTRDLEATRHAADYLFRVADAPMFAKARALLDSVAGPDQLDAFLDLRDAARRRISA